MTERVHFIQVSEAELPAVRALLQNWSREAGAKIVRRAYRRELHDRDPHCAYCRRAVGFVNATIDHKVPRSRGGTDDPSNLVLCCEACNKMKASDTLDEFRQRMLSGLLFSNSYLTEAMSDAEESELVSSGSDGRWIPADVPDEQQVESGTAFEGVQPGEGQLSLYCSDGAELRAG